VTELIGADLLVLLSDIDALYTRPPSEPGARPIAHVPFDDDLAGIELGDIGSAGVGTGGAGTKIAAAKHAAATGTPVLLTSTANVALALAGADTGTWFDAAPS
jgi:glutamate 5-kinase